jgi:hypothetical protein
MRMKVEGGREGLKEVKEKKRYPNSVLRTS